MKAPDMRALDCGLKVKQYMNVAKKKKKINILQRIYTTQAAPLSMTSMRYNHGTVPAKFGASLVKTSVNVQVHE